MFVRFVQDVIAAMDVMVAVLQLVPDVLLAVLISGQKLLWIFEINCAKFIIAGG